jgi:hypothetical protein
MNKLILSLLLGIFLISFTSAWSNNTLFNTNITCIQENITSTSCGNIGVGLGSYPNMTDNNWTSYDSRGSSDSASVFTYTIPSNTINSTILIGIYNENVSIDVPTNCIGTFQSNNISLRYIYGGTSQILKCLNASGIGPTLMDKSAVTPRRTYEVQMIWKINGSISENLTFTGNQNFTRYLLVPQNTYLTKAFMNLTNMKNEYTATKISEVGGVVTNLTSNYTITNTFMNNTMTSWIATCSAMGCSPMGLSSFLLPSTCKNSTNGVSTKIQLTGVKHYTVFCLNNTGSYIKVGNSTITGDTFSNTYLTYEQNITNLNISINNNQIYSYPNIFNQVNNRTSNFASQVNSYLGICSYVDGFCNVPIQFHSDTAGILKYLDSLFNDKEYTVNNLIYNNSVYETSYQSFILNITYSPSSYSSPTAILYYNGSSYSTNKIDTSGQVTFTSQFDIPTTNSVLNKSFYWTIGLYNGTGYEYYNTSVYNQTVNPLTLSYCTTPFTNKTLNFTTYTNTGIKLNSSLEATFNYWMGSGSITKEYNYELASGINQSQFVFCLNATGNVNYDTTISYLASGYDRREHIIDNGIINISSPQNIALYLGATADTDVVTIIVKDQNYNPLNNALVSVQEWNVGTNTYSNIGMLTTNNDGEGIINLELYNTWYRAVVTYEDNIVEVTDVQKLSSTDWPITVSLTTENPYELFDTISHGLVFDNATNITTFTWLDNEGYVNQGCLVIKNATMYGYREISTECISTVSGTINYLLPNNGEYEIYGIIYLVDTYNVSQVQDVLYIRLGTPNLTATVSPFGRVLSFLLIGTAIAIGVSASSPIYGLFLLFGSLFLSAKLGWMNITTSILWGIITIIIVLLLRQTRK